MKNLNIPIYRAKCINSDEYVVGFYVEVGSAPNIYNNDLGAFIIDKSTLAIHFPDMIDGQGNKIFASLQKDGKGGDVVQNYDYGENKYVLVYNASTFEFGIQLIREENTDKDCWEYECLKDECLELFEVTGIQT